jgi:hypothetical protein
MAERDVPNQRHAVEFEVKYDITLFLGMPVTWRRLKGTGNPA